MSSAIYITSAEASSGKALVSLGIVETILRKTPKVGFFKPIVNKKSGAKDEDIQLMLEHFKLEMQYDEAYAYHQSEVNELMQQGKFDDVLNHIIESFKALEERFDFIVVEGADLTGEGVSLEYNHNTAIAKSLGCPILILGNAHDKSIKDALVNIKVAYDRFDQQQVMGVILNRVSPDMLEEAGKEVKAQFKHVKLHATIPADTRLSSPSMRDIAETLDAEVLFGHEKLDNLVEEYAVAAMQMQNFITRLKPNSLVISPGDRGEIIMGTLQANQSANYPAIAGILLSTGLKPEESIIKLLDGISDIVPILSVKTNTYETSAKVHEVIAGTRPSDKAKISYAIQHFDNHVDTEHLASLISNIEVTGMTPHMFLYNIMKKAKSQKQHIVLPEGNEPRILKAAEILLQRGLVRLTLLGKVDEILAEIRSLGLNMDMENLQILDPTKADMYETYAETFYELRKSKGVNMDMARDAMADVSYFGTMMVYKGDADGMVSGAVNTTQHTIRPALQFVKTKPGVSVVSGSFFMLLPDRVLMYADCAVNPNPNSEQLAEIAISTAETAVSFGISEPKIAMLSYSSGNSGKGEDVEAVRNAAKIAKERRAELLIEGPIQYDAAVDMTVGSQKLPGSKVAGQANVLIFPDLNTGNNTYKAVQRETGAIAIGPVLQGLNKPVNDLSRGCTIDDIINTVVITAIQSQAK